MSSGERQNEFHLDPARLPRRVELELPNHLADYIAKRAAVTGRSPSEIVLELLDRSLQRTDLMPDADD